MIPEEVKPSDTEPSSKNEETEPEDWPKEDPDRIRGEVFKRMFPDASRKPPDRPRKPSD